MPSLLPGQVDSKSVGATSPHITHSQFEQISPSVGPALAPAAVRAPGFDAGRERDVGDLGHAGAKCRVSPKQEDGSPTFSS